MIAGGVWVVNAPGEGATAAGPIAREILAAGL
jgi:hypothetical protein